MQTAEDYSSQSGLVNFTSLMISTSAIVAKTKIKTTITATIAKRMGVISVGFVHVDSIDPGESLNI